MRPLSSAMSTALVQPVTRSIYLIRLHFDSVTVCWSSSTFPISFDGYDYTPTSNLGSIGKLSEETGVKSSSVQVTLTGIDPAVVALVMATQYLGRAVIIHYAMVDDAGQFNPDRCLLVFTGSITPISGKQGKTASFDLTAASRLADWERVRKLTYNDADQQRLYPGYKGMEYIPQLSSKKLIWPLAKFLPDPRD